MKTAKIMSAMLFVMLVLSMGGTAIAAYDDPYYDDSAGMGLFSGAYCLIMGVVFLINILILVWVYKDAKKRGASGALWVIVVLFTGIIGLIIWLVVRPPEPSFYQQQQPYGQPQYQQPYQPPPQQQYYQQQPPPQPQQPAVYKEKEIIKEIVKVRCPYCGALVEQGVSRCPHCGAALK